jgi:Tfp pilus assembly protein PilO
MKIELSSSNRMVAAMLLVVAIAAAFWMMLLSPKRDEAKKLDVEVKRLEASLAQHQSEVAEAEAARDEFPTQYQRLVVLGKAVPKDDDIASLLVQLNRISDRAEGNFQEIQLVPSTSSSEPVGAPSTPPAGSEGTPISATEVAASVMPLGATIGPAGLGVMPYEVTFDGNFFDVADFIKGLDSLVKTDEAGVVVDGRLVTVDGFSLAANADKGFPALEATFALTTYLTPPSEGTTGGATPESPETAIATPAATTTGGAP